MNSLAEIEEFINTMDTGEPVYEVTKGYMGAIVFTLDKWKARDDLKANKDCWLNANLAERLNREYDAENKKLVIQKSYAMDYIRAFVATTVLAVARKTSPAKKVKQTNAYKDMIKIVDNNRYNNDFINSALPIINFYYDTKEDSIYYTSKEAHNSNVFALLEILRKKYATKSNV